MADKQTNDRSSQQGNNANRSGTAVQDLPRDKSKESTGAAPNAQNRAGAAPPKPAGALKDQKQKPVAGAENLSGGASKNASDSKQSSQKHQDQGDSGSCCGEAGGEMKKDRGRMAGESGKSEPNE